MCSHLNLLWLSQQHLEIEFQWMMLLTSQLRELCHCPNLDHTKKEDIDHQPCQHLQVSSLLISIFIEVKCTIGAHAVTLRSIHSATDNANGLLPVIDQLPSTLKKADITNFATAKWVPMLLSAMEHISRLWGGSTSTIVVSGVYPSLPRGGLVWDTGCSLSISDSINRSKNCVHRNK